MAKIEKWNWLDPAPPFGEESFDRILVDAPCSNTGVIRRRVDVRWRLTPEDFPRMAEKQFAIIQKTAPLLKKGRVRSLLTAHAASSQEENEKLVERITAEIPSLRFVESRQTLPFRDAIDGAFAAKFERI